MKTTLKIFTLTAVLFGFANISFAQSASDNATVGANILKPLAITKTVDMHFGDIVSQAAAFTVELKLDGTRDASNSNALITAVSSSTTVKNAEFKVEGAGNQGFLVTVPTAAVTLTGTGTASGKTMTADNFTHSAGSPGTLGANGETTFKVGATLNVGDNQEVGEYNGTFIITVNYN